MYGRAAFNKLLPRRSSQKVYSRAFEEFACDSTTKHKGLVLGAYDGCHVGEYRLTHTAEKFDIEVGGRLSQLLKTSGVKLGECVVYNNLSSEFYAIAVAGLGLEGLGYNEIECIEECKENIRIAAGAACSTLQDNHNITTLMVEEFTNPEAAAEGSSLSIWRYQEQKSVANRKVEPNLDLYDAPDRESWGHGIIKGESQNYARYLEESPANIMTPADFAKSAINTLCPCGVAVEVRDRPWLEEKNLCTFLNMAKGSSHPPLLLELSYCGAAEDDKPVMLIGKGITFSTGGLCLKECYNMDLYRADMAGGAVIVAVMKALALLGTPLNVTGLIPLCENMPGGMAVKPGDTIVGRLGKTIRIENTDKEGQVVMSDVLHFSGTHKPCLVVTIATLSSATRHAFGSSASAVFSTSDVVWREMARAGAESGDRVWRMPLWKHYYRKITSSPDVDLSNVGLGIGGDPCVAASFLLECAPPVDFLHIDNTGTGMEAGSITPPYLRQGYMTGRPTRTIIQFLQQIACPNDRPSPC